MKRVIIIRCSILFYFRSNRIDARNVSYVLYFNKRSAEHGYLITYRFFFNLFDQSMIFIVLT